MLFPLLILLIVLCVALGGWAAWFVVRDRPVILNQLWGGAVVEGVLIAQAVTAGISGVTGSSPSDPLLFWGYMATALVILPIAAAWAFAERTKWSSVVLLVAAATVAFLDYRLWQIWTAA